MKKLMYHLILILALVAVLTPMQTAFADTYQALPELIISEVQTGGLTPTGAEDGKQEFVELYNPYDVPYDMTGLQLQYLSATHMGTSEPTRVLTTLKGIVPAKSFITVSYPGYLAAADFTFTLPASVTSSGLLARSGGHVRLFSVTQKVTDLVGWGSATDITPWWKSTEIPAGMSIQRILPDDARFLPTGLAYLAPSPDITPGAEPIRPPAVPPLEPVPPCIGLELTEILSNASGADAGKEFIEVHNFTDQPVHLRGCALQVAEGMMYALPDELLLPDSYRAFYDSISGITLPNAIAQPVKLITSNGQQQVIYADDMPDDTAWALIGSTWQLTAKPTPDAPNELLAKTTSSIANVSTSLAACGPGKERNPDTQRCRNIPMPQSAVCKAGQVRNPVTNRCHSALSGGSTLTPCKTGQVRSVQTNRCQAVKSAAVVKSCPAGQIRNADTNRCRKQAGSLAGHLAAVKDVKSASIANNYRWWLVGAAIAAAVSYGVYEWRHDLGGLVYRTKRRWQSRSPSAKPKSSQP